MLQPPRVLGFPTAVALVIGNMIGSGVFLLPASLAPFGGLSLAGWVVSAGGAVCLALVFARLARIAPEAGGPYAYTRRTFGDFAGFLVAWGYWISMWCANAALATAFVGYLGPLIPGIEGQPLVAGVLAVLVVWVMTAVNIVGVQAAGRVQMVTTIVKILPLLIVGAAGMIVLVPAHFALPDATAPDARPAVQQVLATVTLTLWAFLGLESATVPALSVREPHHTIPRATVVGTLAAAAIYIFSTVGVMGVLPPATLGASEAPFADAAAVLFGGVAAKLVALGAAVSCLGALNGWVLMVGQLPLAVAKDGLFPRLFLAVGARGTPVRGMVVSGVLTSLLVAMNYTRGLVGLFTFIILLSTLATLIPYVFCALAALMKRTDGVEMPALTRGAAVVAVLAFVYGFGAIAGAGMDTVYWGFLLLLAGLPVYAWVAGRRPAGLA